AYLHFAESLLRSEAVANSALKDDAASTRAVAALLARNCVRHHPAAWGPPDGAGWLPSPSTRRWRKRGWRQRRREVVVSSVATALAAKAEPPHSPASTRRTERTRLLQALGWRAGLCSRRTRLDFVSLRRVLHHRRCSLWNRFRLVASRSACCPGWCTAWPPCGLKPAGAQTGLVTRLATQALPVAGLAGPLPGHRWTVCGGTSRSCNQAEAYADLERLVELCGGELRSEIYDRVLRKAQLAASRRPQGGRKKRPGGKRIKSRGRKWRRRYAASASLGLMLRVRRAGLRAIFRIRLDEVQQDAAARGEAPEDDGEG
uniref:40S ribosomal protein S6 n=1 Tax=Macrostomum lignano TaxID=282301 RepID=A0A1I8FIZ0_9PLAT